MLTLQFPNLKIGDNHFYSQASMHSCMGMCLYLYIKFNANMFWRNYGENRLTFILLVEV